MTFPTIEAAASQLGAHQSALIHQFRRLEGDIGAPLYHRSTPRQPMQPTQRGTALLAALARPDILGSRHRKGARRLRPRLRPRKTTDGEKPDATPAAEEK